MEDVHSALAAMKAAWGDRFQVHLTGGEPFLNFPLLLASVKAARALEIPVYVETNAGWCRDMDKAEDRFRQLREAGLGAVLVSVSPFHQESIPLQRTLDGISAARSVFSEGGVIVYQSAWLLEMSGRGIEEPVPLSSYEADYGKRAGEFLWHGYGLISGGRAGYRMGELVPGHPASDFKRENCQAEMLYAQHSHLDLYGNFIPAFCGGITWGDWHGLDRIIIDTRRGEVPPLLSLLIDGGPYRLFQLASEQVGYEEREEGYAGKCHLCVDVRKSLLAAGLYSDQLAPDQYYAEI